MNPFENLKNYFDKNSFRNVKEDLSDLKKDMENSKNKVLFEKSFFEIEKIVKRKENLKKARDTILSLQKLIEIYNGKFQKDLTSSLKEAILKQYKNLEENIKDGKDLKEKTRLINKIIDYQLEELKDSFDMIGKKTLRDYIEENININGEIESIHENKKIKNFLDSFTIEYWELISPNKIPNTNLNHLNIDYNELKQIIKNIQEKHSIEVKEKINFKIKNDEEIILGDIYFDINKEKNKIKTQKEIEKDRPEKKAKYDLIIKENPEKTYKKEEIKIIKEENLVIAKYYLDKSEKELNKLLGNDILHKFQLKREDIKETLVPLMIKESHLYQRRKSPTGAKGYFQITSIARKSVENYLKKEFNINKKLKAENPTDNCILGIIYFKIILSNYIKKIEKKGYKLEEKENFKFFAYNIGITKTRRLIYKFAKQKKSKNINWADFCSWLVKINGYSGKYKTKHSKSYDVNYIDYFDGKENYSKTKEAIDYVEIINSLKEEEYHKKSKGFDTKHKIKNGDTIYGLLVENGIKATNKNIKKVIDYNKNFGLKGNISSGITIRIPKKETNFYT